MNNAASFGKIIIINGPSSSGKTTLALAVQKQWDVPFIRFSFDVFLENHVLPLEQIRSKEFDWPAMRPAIFTGLHQCVVALAKAGNNVLFDHILETVAWRDELVGLLAGLDVFFVGLHCSLDELERREQQRGDRRSGEARADLEIVHRFMTYDLELNSENTPAENAATLIAAWKQRGHPLALEKMRNLSPSMNIGPFLGTWLLVSDITDGKSTPAGNIKNVSVVIGHDSQSVYVGDQVIAHEVSYQIDFSVSPHRTTDFLPDGQQIKGITQVEGDTLTSCVAAVGQDRPLKFESLPGSGHTLRIFKRMVL